jgi:hypothetical protein
MLSGQSDDVDVQALEMSTNVIHARAMTESDAPPPLTGDQKSVMREGTLPSFVLDDKTVDW